MDQHELYMTYHGILLPKICHTTESISYFEKFEFKDDDVIAVTYPKSGTTWIQEILPPILNGGDLTPVLTIPNWDRVPWLEENRAAKIMDKLKSPRAFVSHMPYHLMPRSISTSKVKVIYIARNPKDVMVSAFHFHQMASFLHDPGTFEEFAESFLAGKVMFGKWTDHVKGWKKCNLEDRILHVTYEELIEDLCGVLERIARFLGRQLSEESLKCISEHVQFKNMKDNPMSNYSLVSEDLLAKNKTSFLRKGIAGDWKNHFSAELEVKYNAVISEELNAADIKFPWDDKQNK